MKRIKSQIPEKRPEIDLHYFMVELCPRVYTLSLGHSKYKHSKARIPIGLEMSKYAGK